MKLQFRDIRRASNFAAEPRQILKIDIRELLPVVVAHYKARVLFLDGPRRREAAGGHSAVSYAARKYSQWGHYFRV